MTMRRIQLLLLVLLPMLFVVAPNANGQCDTFLPSGCKAALGNFVNDGNKNSAQLVEGETAELFKTFFANQTYRLVICKADDLPPVHVRVLDSSGRILFDNKNFNYEQVWDFSVKSTQMLDVQMRILPKTADKTKLKKGCVSVIFGIDPKS